jgi:hypothetical protein
MLKLACSFTSSATESELYRALMVEAVSLAFTISSLIFPVSIFRFGGRALTVAFLDRSKYPSLDAPAPPSTLGRLKEPFLWRKLPE